MSAARSSRQLAQAKLRLFLIALILAVLFVALTATGAKRSFLVEVQSAGAQITFHGAANAWHFPNAVICSPRPIPNPRRASEPGAYCSAGIYEVSNTQEFNAVWSANSTVDLRIDNDGALVMEILTGTPHHPAGTLIVIPANSWLRHGAFAFQGAVVIGEDMASGARHYLTEGRWEARETGLAISLFRDITEVVKHGEFARGAQATVYKGNKPAVMSGHVTPSVDKPVFHLAMISEPGSTELHLSHFGFKQPSVIKPDWIDSTLSSPLMLAAILILTLLASLTQVLSDLTRNNSKQPARRPRRQPSQPPFRAGRKLSQRSKSPRPLPRKPPPPSKSPRPA